MTKTIFITGATAGFGAAAARRFAREGWRVIGTGRRGERLRSMAEELGENFLPLELDIRDIRALSDVAGMNAPWGDIDLLLNNAGLAPPTDPLPAADWERVEQVIDTNITGLVALTRALLPKLVERRGQIINLSSVAATYPYKGGAVYAGTKAFVRQFSLDLRCDLAGTGVRVTSIEPGMAETEFTIVRTGGDEEASRKLYADMQPMTADDLADLFWWLANLPSHLNINAIELMPVSQSWAGFTVHREGLRAAAAGVEPPAMSIDQRLAELGVTLPQPAAPVASYVPAVEQGGLLHISGQISFGEDGSLIKGRLGEDLDLVAGIAAARRCGIMLVAQMKAALGSLDRVERVVKLGVFVNSSPDFTDQPKVANGASELMQDVFGEAGRHARSAVGVTVLPLGVAVEVDAIVAVRN